MSHFVDDNRVRISNIDTIAEFLSDKLQAGANVTLNVVTDAQGNQIIQISAGGAALSAFVAVSAADLVPDYLNPKIVPGDGVQTAIVNPGGNEGIQIDAFGSSVTAADTDIGYLNDKVTSGPGSTFTVENPGANENIRIDSYGSSVTATDTNIGYLNDKVTVGPGAIVTIENPGANEVIRIDAYGSSVTAADTDIGYLNDKVTTGPGAVVTIENPGANEVIRIDAYGSSVTAADTNIGYLNDKVTVGPGAVVTIENPGANEVIRIDAYGSSVTAADTNIGYLNDKVTTGPGATITIENPGANEVIRIDSYGSSITAADTNIGYLNDKITAGPGVNLTVENPGADETLRIDAYGLDRQNLLFVGKHGSDGYDGLTPDKSFLTFGAALTAAGVAGPTSTNRFVVLCQDAGVYDEQITVDAYVDVFAPSASLNPTAAGTALTVSYGTRVCFRGIEPQAPNSLAVFKTDTATGEYIPVVTIGRIRLPDTSIGCINAAFAADGYLIFKCSYLSLADGCIGVGSVAIDSGHTHIEISDLYFYGTGSSGILLANDSSIVGFVHHILNETGAVGNTGILSSSGSISLTINTISCGTAYNISGTVNLKLMVISLTGDEISTVAEILREVIIVNGPVGLGHVPQHVGGNDGYGIWSKRTTDSLALLSTRTDGSGNKSVLVVADVNKATIDLDHIITEMGWMNDSDVYSGFWKFKQDQIEHEDATVAELFGTEADGAGAVGVRLGSDNSFTVPGSKLVEVFNNTEERFNIDYLGNVALHMDGNGGALLEDYLTDLVTIGAGATTVATITIPAECQVKAISGYVVVNIPVATTFDVGVAGSVEDGYRYANDVSVVAGSSFHGMGDGVRYYDVATNIYITPDAPPVAATGKVRLVIHYTKVIPPSS